MKSREASLRDLADAAQGIRGDLGQAQRALAEVKALEQGRARQREQAADSLRRLEAVVAGSSTRGAAGENILARALGQLPPDLLETNVPFGNKVVEYALRLPGGRYLPIDSKWTSVPALEALAGRRRPAERRRLQEQVARDLRVRIREVAKYLDPERTLGLGLLAVPDAVYGAAPEAHGEGYREGVLVVPYSLALPYVLALYRLALRFGCAVDGDRLAERLRALDEALRAHRRARSRRACRGRSSSSRTPATRCGASSPGRAAWWAACSTTRRPRPRRTRPRAPAPRAIDARPKLALVCTLRLPPGGRCSVMETLAILVAAGRGERMGAGRPKAFLALAGQPLLVRAARALRAAPSVGAIVAVVPADAIDEARALLAPSVPSCVRGGRRRAAAGLGARPGLAGCPRASTASCSSTTRRGRSCRRTWSRRCARGRARARRGPPGGARSSTR